MRVLTKSETTRYFKTVCSDAGIVIEDVDMQPTKPVIPTSILHSVLPAAAKVLELRGSGDNLPTVVRASSTSTAIPSLDIDVTTDGSASDERKPRAYVVACAIIGLVVGFFVVASVFFCLYSKIEHIFDRSRTFLRPRGNSILFGKMPRSAERDRMEIAAGAELAAFFTIRDFPIVDVSTGASFTNPVICFDNGSVTTGPNSSSGSVSTSKEHVADVAQQEEEKKIPNKYAATVEDSMSP